MKKKLIEWSKRYLPAEFFSMLVTLLSSWITFHYTGNRIFTALTGTWAGNITYYGYIFLQDVRSSYLKQIKKGKSYNFKSLLNNSRDLLFEFGFAEVIDSFFIRPAFMYYIPLHLTNFSTGIIVAKLCADVIFYVPAIIGYEMRKK